MGDFQALELLHATDPLADEADLGRVLTPVVARNREDIRKHASIRSVRAPTARPAQAELVLRSPLQQRGASLSLQVYPLVLPGAWLSVRAHASIVWGGGPVQRPSHDTVAAVWEAQTDLPCRFWRKANNVRGLCEFLPYYVATIILAY